jgi:hypothetical protein
MTFDQKTIFKNELTYPCQQTNQQRTEARALFDREDLSKALNRMLDPVKKVGYSQGIICRVLANVPFSSAFF